MGGGSVPGWFGRSVFVVMLIFEVGNWIWRAGNGFGSIFY